MAINLDSKTARAARDNARRLEHAADSTEPYPAGTTIRRSKQASRMFNVRLTDDQFTALQELAHQRHLPMSTMARAWLLDRLDQERHAS
jgi:hypothetical protein